MADDYALDIHLILLDDFKADLKTKKLLPARGILAEALEPRFAVLSAQGIKTLGALVAALADRKKVTNFAQKSGLPMDYLIVLGREARSYIPKLVYFRDIPGVVEDWIEKLEKVGIKHSKHMFERGAAPADRLQLASETGLSDSALLELAQLADLARITGMGPVFVRLFFAAGVNSLTALEKCEVESLHEALHRINQGQKYSRVIPSVHDIGNYIKKAQKLPKVMVFL